jgi:hypothetical protein
MTAIKIVSKSKFDDYDKKHLPKTGGLNLFLRESQLTLILLANQLTSLTKYFFGL